jgi:hypothetical protein
MKHLHLPFQGSSHRIQSLDLEECPVLLNVLWSKSTPSLTTMMQWKRTMRFKKRLRSQSPLLPPTGLIRIPCTTIGLCKSDPDTLYYNQATMQAEDSAEFREAMIKEWL